MHAVVCRSVLLLEDKTPLGRVEEVFGPLTQPLYALRYGGPQPPPPGLAVGARVCFTGGTRWAGYIRGWLLHMQVWSYPQG
jgi:hypothetical protein